MLSLAVWVWVGVGVGVISKTYLVRRSIYNSYSCANDVRRGACSCCCCCCCGGGGDDDVAGDDVEDEEELRALLAGDVLTKRNAIPQQYCKDFIYLNVRITYHQYRIDSQRTSASLHFLRFRYFVKIPKWAKKRALWDL